MVCVCVPPTQWKLYLEQLESDYSSSSRSPFFPYAMSVVVVGPALLGLLLFGLLLYR